MRLFGFTVPRLSLHLIVRGPHSKRFSTVVSQNDTNLSRSRLYTLVHDGRDTVTTFLEANGRGYWETTEENIELLQDLYQEVEDKIEGV